MARLVPDVSARRRPFAGEVLIERAGIGYDAEGPLGRERGTPAISEARVWALVANHRGGLNSGGDTRWRLHLAFPCPTFRSP